jgi:hypothetical protein
LLQSTDQDINLMRRFADCSRDPRQQDLIEHELVTRVGQRVCGLVLSYEDLYDHDQLRHAPIMRCWRAGGPRAAHPVSAT